MDSLYLQQLAQKVAAKINVPWQWVYAQWQHETGNFSSDLMVNGWKNLGGLTTTPNDPNAVFYNGLRFKTFTSLEDYANFNGWYLQQYGDFSGAKNVNDYLKILQDGGYFTQSDNADNAYYNAVNAWLATLTGVDPYNEPDITSAGMTTQQDAAAQTATNQGDNTQGITTGGVIPSQAQLQAQSEQGFFASITNFLNNFSKMIPRFGYVFVGLLICIGGLFVYANDKTTTVNVITKEGEHGSSKPAK